MVIASFVILFSVYALLDDDKRYRIVHVSIIVLGIYTFGISLLLWWLYKCTAKGFSCIVKDDSKGTYTILDCLGNNHLHSYMCIYVVFVYTRFCVFLYVPSYVRNNLFDEHSGKP